jgi:HYR domain
MTSRNKQRTLVALLTIAMTAGALPGAAQGDGVATGMLPLQAEVPIRYPAAPCPGGTDPRRFECFTRTGNAIVPGLGTVDESYAYILENAPAGCTAAVGADSVRLPSTTARLTVPGKGEIAVSTSGTGCLSRAGTLRATEPFTITGGSGVYAGASGAGTVTTVSFGPPGFGGVDTWTGTLVVPGLQFDVIAPTINGAVDKSFRLARRAKRVRVTYGLTAQDEVDGVVPVTCSPSSGSPFALGRTRVTCSATDMSGNTSTATFTVTVKRRR